MSADVLQATLVAEVGDGLVHVRIDSPGAANLELGSAVELKIGGDARHHVGTVLAILEQGHIKVLLDPAAMTELDAQVEDLDDTLGGLPGDVPPVRGMER